MKELTPEQVAQQTRENAIINAVVISSLVSMGGLVITALYGLYTYKLGQITVNNQALLLNTMMAGSFLSLFMGWIFYFYAIKSVEKRVGQSTLRDYLAGEKHKDNQNDRVDSNYLFMLNGKAYSQLSSAEKQTVTNAICLQVYNADWLLTTADLKKISKAKNRQEIRQILDKSDMPLSAKKSQLVRAIGSKNDKKPMRILT